MEVPTTQESKVLAVLEGRKWTGNFPSGTGGLSSRGELLFQGP